jgi:hypothetical protein
MGKKATSVETIGFNVSAAVSIDRIGYVLKALFDNGCPPSSFDLKAMFGGSLTETNGSAVIEGAPEPKQLSAPKKKAVHATSAEVRKAVLDALAAAHPESVHRGALFETVARKHPSVAKHTLDNVALVFVKAGILTRPDIGFLAITKDGLKTIERLPVEIEPASSIELPPGIKAGTHFAFIYETMRAEPLRHWSKQEMKKHFAANGRAAGSAKDSVQRLANLGLIKRVAPGKYAMA